MLNVKGYSEVNKLNAKIEQAKVKTSEAACYTETLQHIIKRDKMQLLFNKRPSEKLENEMQYI